MKRMRWSEIGALLGRRDRVFMALASLLVGGAVAPVAPAEVPFYATLAATAVAIARIDGQVFRIPDRLSLPLIPMGFGAAVCAGGLETGLARGAAALVLGGVLWTMATGIRRLRGQEALGQGDRKLMVAAALWLPVSVLPYYVLISALHALIVALIARHRATGVGQAGAVGRIAFGVYLAPWLLVLATACRVGLW